MTHKCTASFSDNYCRDFIGKGTAKATTSQVIFKKPLSFENTFFFKKYKQMAERKETSVIIIVRFNLTTFFQ